MGPQRSAEKEAYWRKVVSAPSTTPPLKRAQTPPQLPPPALGPPNLIHPPHAARVGLAPAVGEEMIELGAGDGLARLGLGEGFPVAMIRELGIESAEPGEGFDAVRLGEGRVSAIGTLHEMTVKWDCCANPRQYTEVETVPAK